MALKVCFYVQKTGKNGLKTKRWSKKVNYALKKMH